MESKIVKHHVSKEPSHAITDAFSPMIYHNINFKTIVNLWKNYTNVVVYYMCLYLMLVLKAQKHNSSKF